MVGLGYLRYVKHYLHLSILSLFVPVQGLCILECCTSSENYLRQIANVYGTRRSLTVCQKRVAWRTEAHTHFEAKVATFHNAVSSGISRISRYKYGVFRRLDAWYVLRRVWWSARCGSVASNSYSMPVAGFQMSRRMALLDPPCQNGAFRQRHDTRRRFSSAISDGIHF